MRHLLFFISSLCLITLWGCSEKTAIAPEITPSDEQILLDLINDDPEIADIFYADLDEISEDNFMDISRSQMQISLLKPITPWRFGRIRSHPIERSITFEQTSDSTITAYFHKIMAGRFMIIQRQRMHHDTLQYVRLAKSMHHEFHRTG
jgi:hypothetical protein